METGWSDAGLRIYRANSEREGDYACVRDCRRAIERTHSPVCGSHNAANLAPPAHQQCPLCVNTGRYRRTAGRRAASCSVSADAGKPPYSPFPIALLLSAAASKQWEIAGDDLLTRNKREKEDEEKRTDGAGFYARATLFAAITRSMISGSRLAGIRRIPRGAIRIKRQKRGQINRYFLLAARSHLFPLHSIRTALFARADCAIERAPQETEIVADSSV